MFYILARHKRDSIVDCVASAETMEEVIVWMKKEKEEGEYDWEYKVIRWNFGENN